MKRQLVETLGRRQRGQTLILFTLLFTILIGFLALAIDVGFLFGQRRWNQDGADAAAMAAGHVIAGSISPDQNNDPFISTTDCVLYTEVRPYAGLSTIDSSSCGSPLSSTPTGQNQNPGLDSSNKVAVVMEYWDGTDNTSWCFSPASISALPAGTLAANTYPRSGEGLCTLVPGVDGDFPPSPGSSAYKVRVTVSSVTTSSFAQMIVPNGNLGPGAPSSQNEAACVRPGGANGMLTCSQAVVSISSVESAESGAVIPFTAHDCNLTDSTKTGELYSLWTNNSPPACPDHSENLGGAWKSVLDFSWEQGWSLHDNRFTGWCPVYGYTNAMPDTNVPSGTYQQVYSAYYSPSVTYPNPPGSGWPATGCIVTAGPPSYPANPSGSEHDWQRDGTNGYHPDSTYAGEDNITADVQYWASQGFGGGGRIIPDNGWTDGTTTIPSGHGNYMPTYCNAGGCGGNQGNNIAAALYCTYNNGGGNTTGVTNSGNGCSIAGNNQTTYFFALNQITDVCPLPGDTQADSNVRCRTALIPTWGDPQSYNSGSNKWQSTNNQPDRVKIMEMVPLRMYCEIPVSGSYCTDPPNSLANTAYISGGVGNSSGWGMFVSEVGVCTSNCTGAVGFTVNAATLSQ